LADDETVAPKTYGVAAADLDLESPGFDTVAGHFNYKAVKSGFAGAPFLFGLGQDSGRQRWKA
jgi:hypothetical protein